MAPTSSKAHVLAVGERGRVVIPAALRKALGLVRGAVLVAHVEKGRLVLEDRRALAAGMQGEWERRARRRGGAVPQDVTGELLAERRAQAAIEEAEGAGNAKALARARRQLAELQRRHDGAPAA